MMKTEISKEIIKKFGENHTICIVVELPSEDDPLFGVYTYKGDVFVINDCIDGEFEELDDDIQSEIWRQISIGKYQLNESFQ